MNLIREYVEQYNKTMKEQGSKCAICEKTLEGAHFGVDLGSDGELRGILCGECRIILGSLLDLFDGDHKAMMEHVEKIVGHGGL